jgi:hypothetical protein
MDGETSVRQSHPEGRRAHVLSRLALFLQIVIKLQLHPELLRRAQRTGEANGGIHSHRSLAVNNLVDVLRRHPYGACKEFRLTGCSTYVLASDFTAPADRMTLTEVTESI